MSRDAGIADNLRGIGTASVLQLTLRACTEAASKHKPLVITVLGFKPAVKMCFRQLQPLSVFNSSHLLSSGLWLPENQQCTAKALRHNSHSILQASRREPNTDLGKARTTQDGIVLESCSHIKLYYRAENSMPGYGRAEGMNGGRQGSGHFVWGVNESVQSQSNASSRGDAGQGAAEERKGMQGGSSLSALGRWRQLWLQLRKR